MIIKLVGAVTVVFFMWAYGWYMAEYTKKRINELLDFKKAFTLFADETLYSGGDLSSVFNSVGERCSGKAREIFLKVASSLYEKNCDGANEAWEKAVKDSKKGSFMEDEDFANIIAFGKCLGFSGVQSQVSNVSMTTGYIDIKVKELNEKYTEQSRLFKSLGLMAGMLTVVVIF